jgi:hypothetical protein
LEKRIRKREIPPYKNLKNNIEGSIIKIPVKMFIGKSLTVYCYPPKQKLIFPGKY